MLNMTLWLTMITYHSLHIKNSCALINVLLCCNGTGRKLGNEGSLKLFYMVFQITIRCGDLHQLVRVDLSQAFNVNRLSILINSMMPLRVVF